MGKTPVQGSHSYRVEWQRCRGGLCGWGGVAGSVAGRAELQSRKPRDRIPVPRSDLHLLGVEAGMGGKPWAGQQRMGGGRGPDVGRASLCG